MIFEARFCDRCVHDLGDDCEIHTRALLFVESDEEYPREWQYGEDGAPVCRKFAAEILPPTRAELEAAGQEALPLTGGAPAPLN
jgi:hypothetical protein